MAILKYQDKDGNVKELDEVTVNYNEIPKNHVKVKLKRGKFLSPTSVKNKTEAILKLDTEFTIKADPPTYDDMKFYRWVYNGDSDRVVSYKEEYHNEVMFFNEVELAAEYIYDDETIEKKPILLTDIRYNYDESKVQLLITSEVPDNYEKLSWGVLFSWEDEVMEYGKCEDYFEFYSILAKDAIMLYYDNVLVEDWLDYHMTYRAVMFVRNPQGEQEIIYGPICRLSF